MRRCISIAGRMETPGRASYLSYAISIQRRSGAPSPRSADWASEGGAPRALPEPRSSTGLRVENIERQEGRDDKVRHIDHLAHPEIDGDARKTIGLFARIA